MRQIIYSILTLLTAAFILPSCSDNKPLKRVDTPAPMYPDYTDITIPVNIAPLNFLLRDTAESVSVYADGNLLSESNGNEAVFDESDWKEFLSANAGRSVEIKIKAEYAGHYTEYKTFKWNIVKDSIDPYITYRLIEPDYEVFNRLQLQERCVEDFTVRNFCDYEHVGNRCMNCHTYSAQNPQLSMMYVRGEGGGAVVNRNGKLSLHNINKPGMVSGSVYFGFHPDGRHIVFSSNVIIPAFHSSGSKRLEVYDSASDVYVTDLLTGKIMTCPLLSDSTNLETFPTFSPDGKHIYFCTARKVSLPDSLNSLQYHLCRIQFNAQNETNETSGSNKETETNSPYFGTKVDTLYEAGTSVCHPRISPDGKYLLYTVQSFGTFPIWHREADLRMLDLRTNKVDSLNIVNSDRSDTYHSWSSNSHWFVFASKRDDGLYGKPYFCYIDSQGTAHKPFVLPQKNPNFYDNCLKSFNAPELGKGTLPFDANDVKKLFGKGL